MTSGGWTARPASDFTIRHLSLIASVSDSDSPLLRIIPPYYTYIYYNIIDFYKHKWYSENVKFKKQKNFETSPTNQPQQTVGERKRGYKAPLVAFIGALGVAAAGTGLFLQNQTEAKDGPVVEINHTALDTIQNRAKETLPRKCAYAFNAQGEINPDIVDQGLREAIYELAHQGNLKVVPPEAADQAEEAHPSLLTEGQKTVIGVSAQEVARDIQSDPAHFDVALFNRIGVCTVPQGTVLQESDAYVVFTHPKQEKTNR